MKHVRFLDIYLPLLWFALAVAFAIKGNGFAAAACAFVAGIYAAYVADSIRKERLRRAAYESVKRMNEEWTGRSRS